MAFLLFRNYDGNGAQFGDMALSSVSAAQSQLSVYGALRSSDSSVTILVLNKTYGDIATTLSVGSYTPGSTVTAKAYLYSSANLSTIVPQPDTAISPPSTTAPGSSTISRTFPAQSITLLVLPSA